MTPYEHSKIKADITLRSWIPTWINNTRENISFINKESKVRNLGSSQSIKRLSNKRDTSLFMITGAGPSLENLDEELLRKFPGVIIAGNSTASFFSKIGRPADIILVTDAGTSTFDEHLIYVPVRKDKSLLVCANHCDPRIPHLFDKENVFFYRSIPFINKKDDNNFIKWYEYFVHNLLSSVVADFQIMGGSVIFAEILFVNHLFNMSLINKNYRVFSAGIEFSYPNGINPPHRVHQYIYTTEGEYRKVKQNILWPKQAKDMYEITKKNKKYYVTTQMLRYKDSIMALWRTKKIPIWNLTSGNGILYELPKADLKTLIKKGADYYSFYNMESMYSKIKQWTKDHEKWLQPGLILERDNAEKEMKRRKVEEQKLKENK